MLTRGSGGQEGRLRERGGGGHRAGGAESQSGARGPEHRTMMRQGRRREQICELRLVSDERCDWQEFGDATGTVRAAHAPAARATARAAGTTIWHGTMTDVHATGTASRLRR